MSGQYVRSNEVVWEEIDGEAVIVKPSSKRTWVFNETASYIWKCCDGTMTIDDVARRLAANCNRELRQVKREIVEFCEQLEQVGLIAVSPAAASAASGNTVFRGSYLSPSIKLQSMGAGFRGRPSSRGSPNSPP